MKLIFLFTLMDLATLAAFLVVFILGKLRQFSKSIEGKDLANSTVAYPGYLGD